MKRIAIVLSILIMSQCFGLELVRQKNVATIITFPIVDVNNLAITSAAGLDTELDAWSDGAAPDGFADASNEATEIGATGIYYLSLTQGEMNVDYIFVKVSSSTDATIDQRILIRTQVSDPLLVAATDDGGVINVTAGAIDTATAVTDRVESDLVYIHGTALTETAGQLAGRFTDFFDEAAAGFTIANALADFKATGFAVAGDAMDLVADAIASTTYDESSAWPITASDAGATQIARVGADSDTLETLSDQIDGTATTTELNKVPKSDGSSSWNATALAAIEGEVDDALIVQELDHLVHVADADDPADDSIVAKIFASDGDWSGADKTTDALEAIRDRGDAEWTTGAAGSAPTVEEIRTEIDANSVQLAAIVADTNELQENQGDWATATGFSTHSAADVVDDWESQSQADPTGFHVNLLEVEGTDATDYIESRTLATAAYFVFGTDKVELASTGLDLVVLSNQTGIPSATDNVPTFLSFLNQGVFGRVDQNADEMQLYDWNDAKRFERTVTEGGGTTSLGEVRAAN